MRTVLATLGLGLLGAALTGGVGGAITPLAAGLAGGVAGNLATDLYKKFDRNVCERFLDGWSGVAENHHIVASLRLAQIDAIRALVRKFEKSLGKDDDRAADQLGLQFVESVTEFLANETKLAQARQFSSSNDEGYARNRIVALLPDSFDDALAARRYDGEDEKRIFAIDQVRSTTEMAVLNELRDHCGGTKKLLPHDFEIMFFGSEENSGWFDLFIRDGAEKLTQTNSEFAAIWNAEQTALIKAYVEATNATSEASGQAIEDLKRQFNRGLISLKEIREQVVSVSIDVRAGFAEQTRQREEDRLDLQRILGIVEALKAANLKPNLSAADDRKVDEATRSPDPEIRRTGYLSRRILNMARATHELVLDIRQMSSTQPAPQQQSKFRDEKFDGDLLRAEGDLVAAVRAYERALSIDPNDGFATAALANALIDLALRPRPDGAHWIDDRDAFIEAMDRAGKLVLPFMSDDCAASIEARVAVIWAFSRIWFECAQREVSRSDAIQQSTDALKKADKLDPDNPITLRLLGRNVHLFSTDKALAEQYFRRAVSTDVAGVDSKFFYALFLSEIEGREADAVQMFESCLALEPDDPNTLEAFAQFLCREPENTTRSVLLWKHSLRLYPNHPVGWLHYGRFLSSRAESAIMARQADAAELAGTAEDVLKRGLSYRPNDAGLWCEYAVFLEHIAGRESDAIAAYDKVLAQQPNAVEPYVRSIMHKLLIGVVAEPAGVGQHVMTEGFQQNDHRKVIAGAWLGALYGAEQDRMGALALLKAMQDQFGADMQFIIQSRNIRQAIEAGNPYGQWLGKLAEVIAGNLPLSALSGWTDWVATESTVAT